MENGAENKFLRLCGISEICAESGADYTLPDYLGDVRKILFTECVAKEAGHFSDESGDEFSGIVVYDIVYLDAEGKPTRASFTSDYELRLKADEERARAICSPTVSSYSIRLNGPRRISARANVCASVKCIRFDEIVQSGTAFDEGERLQRKESILNLRCAFASERCEREFAERVEWIEGAVADEVEVIYSTALAEVQRVSAGEGEAVLSGEVTLSALISNDGAPLYLSEKTVPFEVSVPMEGDLDEMKLAGFADTVSVTSSINPDEAGVEVVVSAIVEFFAVGEYNTKKKVSEDVFLAFGEVENTYRDYSYSELCDLESFSASGAFDIGLDKLSSEKIRDIPYLSAVAKIENAEARDGEAVLSGELRVVGVASIIDDDGDISYTGLKFSVPFEQACKLGVLGGDDMRLEHTARVSRISALVDTDTAKISYKLSMNVVGSRARCARVLSSSEAVPSENGSKERSITVYYPTEDDTLFGVAKKYRVPVGRIAAANDISAATSTDNDCSLCGVSRLLIY